MKKFETLVVGVGYNGVESYLYDYISSLNNQDTLKFDVLIIDDGLRNYTLNFKLNYKLIKLKKLIKHQLDAE